jgi:hypothetical protein
MNVNAKPLSELSRIVQCLEVASTPFKTAPQKLISTANNEDDVPYTFVIQTGVVAIHRKSDELLVGIAKAPYIYGLSAWVNNSHQEYVMMAHSHCSGFYLPTSSLYQRLQQASLWQDAFCWLSWINLHLGKRDMQLVGNNSYSQIRAMLINMAEWDETLRSKIGVMNHIQRSTGI